MSSLLKKVFWSAGFGWMFDAMDVGLLSFIIAALSKEWGLNATSAGLLGSVNLLGMALGASLGGYWADRYGRRPIFLSTMVIFGLSSVGSAMAGGLFVMLCFRFVMGIGLGAELPVASTLVNEFAPAAERGRLVVLLESFWALGWILAAAIAYFIIPSYGWRIAVILGAVPILYAIAIRRNIPESPQFRRQSGKIPLGTIWSQHPRQTIALWAIWFAIAFSYYGIFLWLPSVVMAKGFTLVKSFEYVFIMTLAQLPGYFTAAYLVEKWGRKAVLASFLTMTALMATVFGMSETLPMLLVSGALLSFFNLGAWGALYAYTPENYPEAIRGSGTGFSSAVGRLGSILAPYMAGYMIAAKFSFTYIFGIFTIVLLAGVIVLLAYGVETKGSVGAGE
jgi:putative MFS transporter